jgi:hypothetical protein
MVLLVHGSCDDLSARWRRGSWPGETHDSKPELKLTFVWDPHGFQVVHTMSKGEMFTAAYYIRICEYANMRICEYANMRNILTKIVARGREEMKES